MPKVFVYGTLKQGHHNHTHLLGRYLNASGRVKLLGEYTLPPEYTMVSLGGFPGVIEGGKTAIHGEVYEVDDDVLKNLNGLEGYRGKGQRNFYDRIQVAVDEHDCYMYTLGEEYLDRPIVESGEW